MKRLDGALDEGSEKEAGIGAALDGKLEDGCRLVGAGVDRKKILEGELERGGFFIAKWDLAIVLGGDDGWEGRNLVD